MKSSNLILSVLFLMAIIPMVSAVTLPTSAFFCEDISSGIDCGYAFDSNGFFDTYGFIGGGSDAIRGWYNFTEGFGNGINISIYVDCYTASLDYVAFGCKSYNPANDYFVIANITTTDTPFERKFTIPNNCLNPEDNQTAIFYFGATPETTNLNRWYYNFFTELDAPLPPINATISIVYPTATIYNVTIDNLDYEVSDAQACWYSTDLGETNNTITCGQNVTGLNYSVNGTYTWIVYANNSENTLTSDSVTFEVAIPQSSPSPSPSPSPSQQQDILYTVLSSSGTGLGVFLNVIRTPLISIILGVGIIIGIIVFIEMLASHIINKIRK